MVAVVQFQKLVAVDWLLACFPAAMFDMLDAVSAFDVEIRLSVLDQDLPSSPASSRRRITLKGFHCCGYRNGISSAFRGGFPRKALFIQRPLR